MKPIFKTTVLTLSLLSSCAFAATGKVEVYVDGESTLLAMEITGQGPENAAEYIYNVLKGDGEPESGNPYLKRKIGKHITCTEDTSRQDVAAEYKCFQLIE